MRSINGYDACVLPFFIASSMAVSTVFTSFCLSKMAATIVRCVIRTHCDIYV
jgi:hypothetical protein